MFHAEGDMQRLFKWQRNTGKPESVLCHCGTELVKNHAFFKYFRKSLDKPDYPRLVNLTANLLHIDSVLTSASHFIYSRGGRKTSVGSSRFKLQV